MRVTYLINKKIYSILFSIGCGFAFFLALLPVRSRTILYHDEVFDFQPIRQLVSSCSDVPESLHTPLLFGCLPLWASNGYQGTLRGYLFYPLIKLQALTPQSALLIYSLCLAGINISIFYRDKVAVSCSFYCNNQPISLDALCI